MDWNVFLSVALGGLLALLPVLIENFHAKSLKKLEVLNQEKKDYDFAIRKLILGLIPALDWNYLYKIHYLYSKELKIKLIQKIQDDKSHVDILLWELIFSLKGYEIKEIIKLVKVAIEFEMDAMFELYLDEIENQRSIDDITQKTLDRHKSNLVLIKDVLIIILYEHLENPREYSVELSKKFLLMLVEAQMGKRQENSAEEILYSLILEKEQDCSSDEIFRSMIKTWLEKKQEDTNVHITSSS